MHKPHGLHQILVTKVESVETHVRKMASEFFSKKTSVFRGGQKMPGQQKEDFCERCFDVFSSFFRFLLLQIVCPKFFSIFFLHIKGKP